MKESLGGSTMPGDYIHRGNNGDETLSCSESRMKEKAFDRMGQPMVGKLATSETRG